MSLLLSTLHGNLKMPVTMTEPPWQSVNLKSRAGLKSRAVARAVSLIIESNNFRQAVQPGCQCSGP